MNDKTDLSLNYSLKTRSFNLLNMGIKQIQTTNTINVFGSNTRNSYNLNKSNAQKLIDSKNEMLIQLTENHEYGIHVFTDALKKVLKLGATLFKNDRMSLWVFNNNNSKLICIQQFNLIKDYYSRGLTLNENQYPVFFEKLLHEDYIMSINAQKDASLKELTESYLVPQKIKSVYYIPIRYEKKVRAVLCCEQTIAVKYWNNEEQSYMNSLAQFISLIKGIWEGNNIQKSFSKQNINLQAILNNNDSSIWFIDNAFRLLDFNKNFKNKIKKNRSINVVKNLNCLSLFPKEEQSKWEFRYKNSLEGHSAIYYDKVQINGTWRTFEIRTIPLKNRDKIETVYVYEKDITEKEIAVNKIKEIEKKNKNILQSFPDFVIECNNKGKIINCNKNKNTQSPFTVNKKLIQNKYLHQILEDSIASEFLVKIDQVLYGDKNTITFEYKIKDFQSSEIKEIEARIINSIKNNVIVFLRDVTGIKKNERKLNEQNKQLLKLNRELDRLVYSASHDLRAPLSTLLGLINVAETAENEERKKYFSLMEQSVKRLDLIIKEILNLSKNKRTKIKREKIELKKIINECFENCNFLSNKSNIKLIIDEDRNSGFYSDSNRVEVVINSLISNAIKFSNSITPFITIDIELTPEFAFVKIHDNGDGIKKEYQNSIFDMFFKGNEKYPGSGLGLYISKEIIDTLKGSIELHSDPLKGTTAYVRFPNLL